MKKSFLRAIHSQEGVSAVLVGIMILMFVSFAALAIDVGHLAAVRNELKNAADSGALAGAGALYNNDGTVNVGANQVGYDAATLNKSEKTPVDVHWPGGNEGDVQRGHWSFATRTFTANDTLAAPQLWDLTFEELDTYDAGRPFINAVKVRARRQDTPAASFLATIFGNQSFVLQVESVAWLGFSGSLAPGEVKEPVAICEGSIQLNGEYSCNIGRFINNSGNVDTSQTGEWSNLQQGEGDPASCSDAPSTNNNNVRQVVQPQPNVCGCDPDSPSGTPCGNVNPIYFGASMSTNNGELQNAFDKLIDCWRSGNIDINGDNKPDPAPAGSIDQNGDGIPDRAWNLTLPVIDCTTGGPTCRRVVGAVNVNVLWITGAGDDPQYQGIPLKMEDWTCSTPGPIQLLSLTQRIACWGEFVAHFNLKNADGTAAPYAKKSIYFKPDCTPHIPTGTSGGFPSGIMARIPKLVQ